MAAILPLTMAGLATVGAAHASSLTPDFNALTPSAADLPRTGDFDGDGRMDRLVLVAEPGSNRVAVHVELNTASGIKDIRVTSFDAEAGGPPDLRVVPAGAYAGDCGSFSTDCAGSVTAAHDSLMLGMAGGASLLIHWQAADQQFAQDFVRSDEDMMAHALAALYAANP
jgi:hypothetical protein